jgi:uncharacterized phage-like protein YoqJ
MMKETTCCFTGHRPNKFAFRYNEEHEDCVKIKELITQEVEVAIAEGYVTFISGMALGVDMWAAEAVLMHRKEYPHIKLIAAVPCQNQERMWPKASQDRYNAILAEADEVVLVTDAPYNPKTMIDRDQWMVDRSDRIIAVFDGSDGGTKHTYDYALDKGIEIVRIHPVDMELLFPFEMDDEKRKARLQLLYAREEAGEKEAEAKPADSAEEPSAAAEPKVLHCYSKGDKRFSAFYAKVTMLGKTDTIENHYQLAKRFGEEVPKTAKDAKGRAPTHLELDYLVSPFTKKTLILDASQLTPWYKLLWVKYFIENPDLLAYARTFDQFLDIFKGKNTLNCQADVIEEIAKRGTKAVMEDVASLVKELNQAKEPVMQQ